MNDSTSTTSPDWPTRWPQDSFKNVWTWLLATFVAGIFIVGFVVSNLHGKAAIPTNVPPWVLDVSFAVTFLLEGALVLILLLSIPPLSKMSLRDLGFVRPTGKTILAALVGAVAMVVVANGLANLIDHYAHLTHEQDVVELFKQVHDPVTITIFALFAIVFAPFAEETIFRIFFFNLGLRFGGFWTGAVLSGVLFGTAHGDIYVLVPLACGGIILCGVYYYTRNAWASMITHACFNALSIVALLVTPKLTP